MAHRGWWLFYYYGVYSILLNKCFLPTFLFFSDFTAQRKAGGLCNILSYLIYLTRNLHIQALNENTNRLDK